jgi:hypothetical protein
MSGFIALGIKDVVRRDIAIRGVPLIHEAAHARQIKMPRFSGEWLRRFPIIIPTSYKKDSYDWRDPSISRANATASCYATKDYTVLEHVLNDPSQSVEGNLVVTLTSEGLPTVEFYNIPASDAPMYFKQLMANYLLLPQGLQEFVRLIKVDKKLNRAYHQGYSDNRAFCKTCEDVAEMTQWAIVASLVPESSRDLITLIEREEPARERIRMLFGNGFIDGNTTRKLLDPIFRSYWKLDDSGL